MKRSSDSCARVWSTLIGVGLLWLPGFSPAAQAVAEQEPEPVEQTRETQAEPSAGALPGGRVARSAFTTVVVDREPADTLDQLANDVETVSYFTELRGLEGQTVTHRWEFAGEVVTEVSFEVGAPHWRVYSTKTLDRTQLGDWSVSVLDAQGKKLSEESLSYVAVGSVATDEGGAPAAPPAANE